MVPEIRQQEEEKDVVVFYHLRAEMIKDFLGGEVRITSSDIFARRVQTSIEDTLIEKQWHQLKEVYVNQIHTAVKQKTALQIRSFILESYYNWVVKSRSGDNNALQVPMHDKVLWFLEELANVIPNPSIMKMAQLMDFNKKDLLKHHILTKIDIVTLYVKATTPMLKTIRYETVNKVQLLQIFEFNVAQVVNYKFLRQSLLDTFNTENEVITEHLALLDRVNKAVHQERREILADIVQGSSEKLVLDAKSYYDLVIDNWEEYLQNAENLDMLTNIKGQDTTIADFITDSNESSKTEMKSRDVTKMPKKNENVKVGRFDDFEYFILTEIEKAGKNSEQDTIRKYQEHDIPRDSADNTSNEIIKSNKVLLNVSPQNESKADKLKNKIKYQIEFIKNKMDDFAKDANDLADFNKITNTLENLQANNIDFQETIVNNNSVEKQAHEESLLTDNNLQLKDAQVNSPNVNTVEEVETEVVLEDMINELLDSKYDQEKSPNIEHSHHLNKYNIPIASSKQLNKDKSQVSNSEGNPDSLTIQEQLEILSLNYNSIDGLTVSPEYEKKEKNNKDDVQKKESKHIGDEL